MPPLTHAVGFIDREERELRIVKQAMSRIGQQTFRCHIEQFQFASAGLLSNLVFFGARQRAIQKCSTDSASDQRVDLIFHQRDQRRHDDRQPLTAKRGCLKTERLSGSRWKHGQRILVLHHRHHGGQLSRPKTVKAPVLLERCRQPSFDLLFV